MTKVEKGKREKTKELNKATIQAAALSVFQRKGYETTTVRDIIRQTDLASGTFYNYYADKETLFKDIVQDFLVDLTKSVRSTRQTATCIQEFVYPAYYLFFKAIAENPTIYILTTRNNQIIEDLFEFSAMAVLEKELRQDIQLAIDMGLLPKVDVEFLSATFMGIGYQLGGAMIARKNFCPKYTAEFATSLFLGGISALPESQLNS